MARLATFGMAAALLAARAAAARECEVVVPQVVLAPPCADRSAAAGQPSALLAQAAAHTAVAADPACPRRALAAAGRAIRRARALVERSARRGMLGEACAGALREQIADAVRRRLDVRDRLRDAGH